MDTSEAPAILIEPLVPRDHELEDGDSPSPYISKRRKVEVTNDKPQAIPVPENTVVSEISPMTTSKWQATIENVVKAIVSIRFSQVASFDTDGPVTSEASGFIVDSKNGLILTNRHVACSGPFVGEAICHDHEEIDVYPVYRDPVHDFGFLKFDPSKIKYMDVTQVTLRPEIAQIGLDIRVVGNDAGEKLSILAGSISRLDRNVPYYGELTYNDFNTFYLQAASSTSGGSSGSPVIDIDGNAVALQAGGHVDAATDFFLPLDRVKRALSFIQQGLQVPRGDIQTQFFYRPFDEARRLGLQSSTEETLRKICKDEIGLLVVETVLPEGPTHGKLEEGDVLLTVNGGYITKFVPLEELLDNNVDKDIVIGIERGGKPMEFVVRVGDLHTITPNRYVEIGGSQLHELSYQLARAYCVPCRGVYVSDPSGMFRLDGPDNGWIIKSVDDKPTPNLDTFIEVMKTIPDRKRISVVYYSIADRHTTLVTIVRTERHWSSFRLAIRNDKTGLWDFSEISKAVPPSIIVPKTNQFVTLNEEFGPARDLIRCIVKVHYYMPYPIDGLARSRKRGTGVIFDKDQGLVVISRSIVPTSLGDLTLTFADSIVLPAKVVFLHPTYNFVIAKYDPSQVGNTQVMSVPISSKPLEQGNRVTLVAYNHNDRPICLNTTVTDITCVSTPIYGAPRFRSVNLDVVTVDTPLALQCSPGVLADKDGKVQGLWLNFMGEKKEDGRDGEYHLGVDVSMILSSLKAIQNNEVAVIRTFNAELMPVQMAQAAAMGLSETWIRRVEEANHQRHQLFMVRRTEAEIESSSVLKELDLILTIDDNVITRLNDINLQQDDVKMTILRQKEELTVTVKTRIESTQGTSRLVFWAGAILQEPHKAVLQLSKIKPSEIYISSISTGSPASMYGLTPMMWITHINSQKVTTLDDLIGAVASVEDNTYVRVRCVSFDNIPSMLSVKMVNHYFPLAEMVQDAQSECGWTKKKVTAGDK